MGIKEYNVIIQYKRPYTSYYKPVIRDFIFNDINKANDFKELMLSSFSYWIIAIDIYKINVI